MNRWILVNRWILGARLPTLSAAIVPVLVGTAAAGPPFHLGRAALAAIVALALQVGVNYANDYSDGIRGTDTRRVGPPRLVASGLATPREVKRAAFVAFGVAVVAGVALSLQVNAALILIGVAAITAAWTYTGGKNPYGYRGLGELAVFVFFGVVGTFGAAYVQHREVPLVAALAALPVGATVTAILVVNNLRDIPGDRASGKRTLAVRLGDPATRRLYLGLLALAAVGIVAVGLVRPGALLALAALVVAISPVRSVRAGATGRALVPVLVQTGRLHLILGVLIAIGLLQR